MHACMASVLSWSPLAPLAVLTRRCLALSYGSDAWIATCHVLARMAERGSGRRAMGGNAGRVTSAGFLHGLLLKRTKLSLASL